MNTDLAICIPTYNRASILDDTLASIIPKAGRHNIPIYISDNASTDLTEQIVAKYMSRYPFLHYYKNSANIGPDQNFEMVLRKSPCRYSWLLSDDDRIADQALSRILAVVALNNYDMIILNGGPRENKAYKIAGRVRDIATAVYTDHSRLLSDIGWHMQWISCLIFSKQLISDADFHKYRGTCLIQFGIIFDYIARNQFKIYWLYEPLVYPYEHSDNMRWGASTFNIFAKNWHDTTMSLPEIYSKGSKYACIKKHGMHSGLFSLVGLMTLRETGTLNHSAYKEYKYYLPFITNIPRLLILFIALAPTPLIHILKFITTKILGLKQLCCHAR